MSPSVRKPTAEFLQVDPDEGKPQAERTEVRFLFDDDALFGARPDNIFSLKITWWLAR